MSDIHWNSSLPNSSEWWDLLRKTQAIQHLESENESESPPSLKSPSTRLPPYDKSWPPNYEDIFVWREKELARYALDPVYYEKALIFYSRRPIHWINHWCDTYDTRKLATGQSPWVPFILFQKQAEFITFLYEMLTSETNGLLEKSRDMGATWLACSFSVWLWRFLPGASIGWGSRDQTQVDRIGVLDSLFEKMRQQIMRLPRVFWPSGFLPSEYMHEKKIVNPQTGSVIAGEVGDKIGRGGRSLIYFLDEAAHLDHPDLVEASLMETTRCQIAMSSVNGIGNLFYNKREAGTIWVPGEKPVRTAANVFVMDWREHPEKSLQWYEDKKLEAISNGTQHLFAQEIDRDYAASLAGVIIPPDWVKACIDAHEILGFDDAGLWVAGLDVADEGNDRNALVKRKGSILKFVEEWGERDVYLSARRAIQYCQDSRPIEVQYDSVGIGTGIKGEVNRLREEGDMPKGIYFVPWNGGAAVLNPFGNLVEDDDESPRNRDIFSNLKAQAWWAMRRRCENTYRAIKAKVEVGDKGDWRDVFRCSTDELFAIPSDMPRLRQIERELSQATFKQTPNMKIIVDKKPDGARSPNIADAVVMCCFPWEMATDVVSTVAPQFIMANS
jgi:phage terminase large subunit